MGVRAHVCASGHAWGGGLCLSTLTCVRLRGPSPVPR